MKKVSILVCVLLSVLVFNCGSVAAVYLASVEDPQTMEDYNALMEQANQQYNQQMEEFNRQSQELNDYMNSDGFKNTMDSLNKATEELMKYPLNNSTEFYQGTPPGIEAGTGDSVQQDSQPAPQHEPVLQPDSTPAPKNTSAPQNTPTNNHVNTPVENPDESLLGESLEAGIEANNDDSVNVYLGNGQYQEVNSSDVDQTVRELLKKTMTEGSDYNNNHVDDRIELEMRLPLFTTQKPAKGELPLADRITFGRADKGRQAPKVPSVYVQSSKGKTPTVGSKVLLTLFGGHPDEEVSVYLGRNKDSNAGNSVLLGKTKMDNERKGLFSVEMTQEGEFYIFSVGENGIGEKIKIKVDFKQALDVPEVQFEQKDLVFDYGHTVGLILNFTKQQVPAISDKIDKFVAEHTQKNDIANIQVVTGVAQPGMMVFATWESLIRSSVVIADASGKFKFEIPKEVSHGKHKMTVFVYNRNKSLLSNITSLFIGK